MLSNLRIIYDNSTDTAHSARALSDESLSPEPGA